MASRAQSGAHARRRRSRHAADRQPKGRHRDRCRAWDTANVRHPRYAQSLGFHLATREPRCPQQNGKVARRVRRLCDWYVGNRCFHDRAHLQRWHRRDDPVEASPWPSGHRHPNGGCLGRGTPFTLRVVLIHWRRITTRADSKSLLNNDLECKSRAVASARATHARLAEYCGKAKAISRHRRAAHDDHQRPI